MRDFLHHVLFPRDSNNYRAKVLHNHSLFLLILFLLVTKVFLNSLSTMRPDILGMTASFTAEELLVLTNQKRAEAGLAPLVMDTQLANAAAGKAQDMFTKNYWAHNAPDGLTPWAFIKGSGYEYLYAGENLARGFNSASAVVDAWMNSPGHRENMMSSNYKNIGFAIVPGTLTGDETILVVEMFGTRYAGTPDTSAVAAAPAEPKQLAQAVPTSIPTSIPIATITTAPTIAPTVIVPTVMITRPAGSTNMVASIQSKPLVNENTLKKNMALWILGFILGIFLIDLVIIERKRIARIAAHSADHVIFFVVIFVILLMIGGGAIL